MGISQVGITKHGFDGKEKKNLMNTPSCSHKKYIEFPVLHRFYIGRTAVRIHVDNDLGM